MDKSSKLACADVRENVYFKCLQASGYICNCTTSMHKQCVVFKFTHAGAMLDEVEATNIGMSLQVNTMRRALSALTSSFLKQPSKMSKLS